MQAWRHLLESGNPAVISVLNTTCWWQRATLASTHDRQQVAAAATRIAAMLDTAEGTCGGTTHMGRVGIMGTHGVHDMSAGWGMGGNGLFSTSSALYPSDWAELAQELGIGAPGGTELE